MSDRGAVQMTITVNGIQKEIDRGGVSILELLSMEAVASPDMVSVQLNGDIVKRDSFETTSLTEDDEVEFLYFMGGGSK